MHSHTAKVLKWGLDEESNFKPSLYGCTDCNETFDESPSNGNIADRHEHTEFVQGCFACKLPTLQLNPGDANGNLVAGGWTNKKWNNELDLYASARKQGIQPAGTSTAKVRAALDASDKVGVAYGT
jgi:hypothetical protein